MRQTPSLQAVFALLLVALLTAGCAGTVPGTRSPAVDPDVTKASIQADVYVALLEKLGRDGLPIDVEVQGSRAVLTGQVGQRSTQELAEEVTLSVPGVRSVDNRVTVAEEASRTPVGQAVSHTELEVQDAVLEARVGRALLAEIGRYAFDVEVESTDGAVSLRGTLPDPERKSLALRTAEKISGVKKVVDLLRVRE
jgi:hyperosmotically inducible protein